MIVLSTKVYSTRCSTEQIYPAPRHKCVTEPRPSGSRCLSQESVTKGVPMNLWMDLRHALRILRRSPAAAGIIVVTLALCIGADRKSTRLNSSHLGISYAVFCL